LGRMMIKYFKTRGIKLINIVRKQEYVDELLKAGADYVLNSTDPDFDKKLKEAAEKENALTAFDAVAGDLTGRVLAAMPNHSTIYVYGALGGPKVKDLNVEDLLFKGKTAAGLWLSPYLRSLTPEQSVAFFKEVHSNLDSTLKSNIQKVFTLDQWEEAYSLYEKKSSEGKILFKPN
jgi:NADPH:quinone reductase and related Zn-dependent oxidoreductases